MSRACTRGRSLLRLRAASWIAPSCLAHGICLAALATSAVQALAADAESPSALLLIAHPDDECMFFGPTVQHQRDSGADLHLVSLSTGTHNPLAGWPCRAALIERVHTQEMQQARALPGCRSCSKPALCFTCGLAAAAPGCLLHRTAASAVHTRLQLEHCQALDLPQLRDGEPWTDADVAAAVTAQLQRLQPAQARQRPSAAGTLWAAQQPHLCPQVLTFDGQGVSGHQNHQALHRGSRCSCPPAALPCPPAGTGAKQLRLSRLAIERLSCGGEPSPALAFLVRPR